MGSLSAMSSLERVLEAHGEELREEYLKEIPDQYRKTITGVVLSNNTYTIDVEWEFNDGNTIPGPKLEIDDMAERFPDCNVGY